MPLSCKEVSLPYLMTTYVLVALFSSICISCAVFVVGLQFDVGSFCSCRSLRHFLRCYSYVVIILMSFDTAAQILDSCSVPNWSQRRNNS